MTSSIKKISEMNSQELIEKYGGNGYWWFYELVLTVEDVKNVTNVILNGGNRAQHKLGFVRSEITDDSIKEVAEMLKVDNSLTHIAIEETPISHDSIKLLCDALKSNKTVLILELYFINVTDDDVQELAEMLKFNKALRELRMERNQITDRGVKMLADVLSNHNSTLVLLALSYNKITDDGAAEFSEMLKVNKTFEELQIGDNQIGDQGMKMLCDVLTTGGGDGGNRTLTFLYMNRNQITDESVDKIVEMIIVNDNLKRLHLADMQISEAGFDRIYTARGTKSMQIIK
ncbi:unnamed protein product [Didymodactylos carnosus]|uniref:Uncharacterized protein n=1 Tax=Didymodactylos carnosus TaxID=1234261 RepID=A0A815YI53_9BILA|nr:unnamed protein product [Didymodactylos carnosus]CAF1570824.1 unnamed protein product [Didymodactylos carnosus]CAF4278748.1 unnamed protein product [Didymodactylos carnosus]CAF4434229.1 unnamed protein product [Didymodactylos carnosus]